MEEKILVESKLADLKEDLKIIFKICLICFVAYPLIRAILTAAIYAKFGFWSQLSLELKGIILQFVPPIYVPELLLTLSPFIIYFIIKGYLTLFGKYPPKITVTDKHIYIQKLFGNSRMILPIDKIESVSISGKRGITVSTATEKIAYTCFENRDELFEVINNLINSRQEK